MFYFVLLCTLLAQNIWALPAPIPHADTASHIVIVTPQAQVHLEPALNNAATYIHHLSPLARLATPHEETIVYVPAGAAAGPLIPLEAVTVGGRATTAAQAKPVIAGKQFENPQQQFEQIGMAIQQSAESFAPQIAEAAQQASQAASAAGSSFFPALFPPPANANADTDKKESQLKITEIETPANTQPLIAAEARRFYSIAPVVPHVVDIVHAPVYLSPVTAIRGRSIQTYDNAITLPLKLDEKAEAKPLKNALKEESEEKPEKKQEFARAIEGELAEAAPLPESVKRDAINSDQEPAASNIIASEEPIPAAVDQPAGITA